MHTCQRPAFSNIVESYVPRKRSKKWNYFGFEYIGLILIGNTYPAMIGITDDWGIKVFIGFSNSLKNLIGTFYRSSVEVV